RPCARAARRRARGEDGEQRADARAAVRARALRAGLPDAGRGRIVAAGHLVRGRRVRREPRGVVPGGRAHARVDAGQRRVRAGHGRARPPARPLDAQPRLVLRRADRRAARGAGLAARTAAGGGKTRRARRGGGGAATGARARAVRRRVRPAHGPLQGGRAAARALAWLLARLPAEARRGGRVEAVEALRLVRALAPFAAAFVALTVYYKVDVLLLARWRDAAEVGLYAAAYKFVDVAHALALVAAGA